MKLGDFLTAPGSVVRNGAAMLAAAVVLAFYLFPVAFGQHGNLSALHWVWNACNQETDYLHGRFVPLAIALLIYFQRDQLAAVVVRPNT